MKFDYNNIIKYLI